MSKQDNPELKSALAAIVKANADLEHHKATADKLRTRIVELDGVIAECQVKATERASMADLSLTDIRALANRKNAALGEIAVLNEVRALVETELNEVNSKDYWMNEAKIEAVKNGWKALFDQFMQNIPMNDLQSLISIGYLCGITQGKLAKMLLPDQYDASLLESLSNKYGLPL